MDPCSEALPKVDLVSNPQLDEFWWREINKSINTLSHRTRGPNCFFLSVWSLVSSLLPDEVIEGVQLIRFRQTNWKHIVIRRKGTGLPTGKKERFVVTWDKSWVFSILMEQRGSVCSNLTSKLPRCRWSLWPGTCFPLPRIQWQSITDNLAISYFYKKKDVYLGFELIDHLLKECHAHQGVVIVLGENGQRQIKAFLSPGKSTETTVAQSCRSAFHTGEKKIRTLEFV